MREPAYYIQKTDELMNNINEFMEDTFSSKHSLEKLVSETELLFYGYSENYPSLLDIKQLKERYNGSYYDYESTVSAKLLLVLSLFKSFIVDRQ